MNRALLANPENKIINDQSGIVKGIELKPEINNKAVGEVVTPSTFTNRVNISNNPGNSVNPQITTS